MDNLINTIIAPTDQTKQKGRRRKKPPQPQQQAPRTAFFTEAEKLTMFWKLSSLIRLIQKADGLDLELDALYEKLDLVCAASRNAKLRQGRDALNIDRISHINAQMARRFGFAPAP